jgi:hypothetical protein
MSSDATATFFAATKAAGTTVEVDFGDKTIAKHAIGYWSIRGLGAPLTMMMCASKTPFTLFLYDIVEKGEAGWNSDYFSAKGDYMREYNRYGIYLFVSIGKIKKLLSKRMQFLHTLVVHVVCSVIMLLQHRNVNNFLVKYTIYVM